MFAYLCAYIFNMFKVLRARLHYDVIVTSYADEWYLFWYQWNEETHSYSVLANIRYRTFIIENLEGGCNNPLKENDSGVRGLIYQCFISLYPPPQGRTTFVEWALRGKVECEFECESVFGCTVVTYYCCSNKWNMSMK